MGFIVALWSGENPPIRRTVPMVSLPIPAFKNSIKAIRSTVLLKKNVVEKVN